MASGGDNKTKKGGKGSPKLKRSSRHRTKYALQFARTFKNKLRRVRRCNGEDAARRYASRGVPQPSSKLASSTLPKPPAKHSVVR